MIWVLAIPLLPAAAFVALLPLSRALRNRLLALPVAAVIVSAALSLIALARIWPGGKGAEPLASVSFALAHVGGEPIVVGMRLDPFAALMVVVVTFVGAMVQIYSLGYMRDEARVGWYYAVLSLFTAAMLVLVLADDFLLMYMAWEVMGVCSYLLIGFWHELEAPRQASMKAFITTRIGDVGFALGLAAMWATAGSFRFDVVLGEHAWASGAATVVALLLFGGAVGKSAQAPLHVWLPDAMAGPTPASALIHAATMVAAGVFLVVRAFPIFEASGVALTVVLTVGLITAAAAALLALAQHDIKKVLAYSTISQLGFMFIALGAGSVAAAMFHLATHAFFKSLLFLGAGVIIHAAHTQDMREMGGLARHLPVTSAAFGVGSLALAGLFPFSGFWSKDEVLAAVYHEHHYLALAIALGTAYLTALYVSRLWFRVFTGPEQRTGLHEGGAPMVAPLVALGIVSALAGFAGPALSEFLGFKGHWPELGLALVSTAFAAAGLVTGWWLFGRRSMVLNTRMIKQRMGRLYDVFAQRLYADATYEFLFVYPYLRHTRTLSEFDGSVIDGAVNGTARLWRAITVASEWVDRVIVDGAVNGSAAFVRSAGRAVRRIQVGRVQSYQTLMMAALLLIVVWILVKGV